MPDIIGVVIVATQTVVAGLVKRATDYIVKHKAEITETAMDFESVVDDQNVITVLPDQAK